MRAPPEAVTVSFPLPFSKHSLDRSLGPSVLALKGRCQINEPRCLTLSGPFCVPSCPQGAPAGTQGRASLGRVLGKHGFFFLIKKTGHQCTDTHAKSENRKCGELVTKTICDCHPCQQMGYFLKESNIMHSGSYFWETGRLLFEDWWPLIRDSGVWNTQAGSQQDAVWPGTRRQVNTAFPSGPGNG